MNKPVLKWSPSHPVRARDNLISAAAIEKNQLGFKPTYEAESKSEMNSLMSQEYMRVWYKERGQYEKDVYSREETIKEESKIKRRVVQRMMTYRKPMKNDFIDDFIQKKKGNKEAQIQMALTPEKMKYKPECYRRKGSENKAEPAKEIAAEAGTQDVKKQKEVEAQKHGKQEGIKQEKEGKQRKPLDGEKINNKKREEADDECDVADEVLLVCPETNVEQGCCKCENNKEY